MNIDPFKNGWTPPDPTTASPNDASPPSKNNSSIHPRLSPEAEPRRPFSLARHIRDESFQASYKTKKSPVGKTIDLPELCVVGIGPEASQGILNDLAQRITNGSPLRHGQRLDDVLDGFDVLVVEGPATGIIQPSIALHKYGTTAVRLQQIVWPDPEGVFPWEAGYSMRPGQQPVIATC